MRILSVDRGDVRTGLAVCDPGEMLASPVAVLTVYHEDELVRRVADEARQLGAQEIVVGLPRNMDGSEGESAQKCRAFGDALREATNLPVTMWDERLTTSQAHLLLSAGDVRGKKRKKTVDAVAAVLILENYLASRRQRKEAPSV